MLLWDHMKRFTVYRKLFLSYSILVIITVSLISSILFRLFSHSSIMEVNNISQSMLTQTSYAADVIYDQVFSIGNELMHNNEIITAMHSKRKDAMVEYSVIQKLSYIQAVYPFINYVSIYNGNTNRYLNNKAISAEIDNEVLARIQGNDGTKYYDFIPRTLHDEQTGAVSNVLTFVLYSNFSQLLPKNGALIININENYINKIIQGMTNRSDSTIFVIDKKGTVLSHSDPTYFLNNFGNMKYIRDILNSEVPKNYMIDTLDNEKHLITYVKSDPARLEWIFISVQPYRLVLSGIYRLLYITLVIAAALMILGVLISVLLVRKLYNPISTLVKRIGFPASGVNPGTGKNGYNEFELLSEAFSKTMDRANSMEVSLKNAFPVLKETYLSFLLKGNMEKLPETATILKELNSQLTEKYFCVLVFKIDGYSEFERSNSSRDKGLLRFSICNISQELLENHCKNNTVDLEKDHIVMLAQLDTAIMPEKIYLALEEVQNVVSQYFKLSISIGIGDTVTSTNEIHHSYKSAQEYVSYRMFFGLGCIADRSRMQNRLSQLHDYPYQFERNILEGIQSGDWKITEKWIGSFIASLNEMTYHHVFIYSNQLVVSILKEFGSVLPVREVDYTGYYRIINSFGEIEIMDEVAACIKSFSLEVLTKLEECRNSKNKQLLTYVCEYVREHYSDPNLSLELAAVQVHFSSGYLGKMFKKTINKSFNDYVNTIRLEKARELLACTNDSSMVIGERVGILNNTYFFTLFKKTYGITPTQYRNQLNIKRN